MFGGGLGGRGRGGEGYWWRFEDGGRGVLDRCWWSCSLRGGLEGGYIIRYRPVWARFRGARQRPKSFCEPMTEISMRSQTPSSISISLSPPPRLRPLRVTQQAHLRVTLRQLQRSVQLRSMAFRRAHRVNRGRNSSSLLPASVGARARQILRRLRRVEVRGGVGGEGGDVGPLGVNGAFDVVGEVEGRIEVEGVRGGRR